MRRPNVLIFYTDQQRWDAVGVNGNPDLRTPHLDQLAAEGVTFDHCFVQNPVCMPSRVSFLTGQYPSTLGITHMGVPVPPDTPALPRLLKPYGYRTANLGKLHFLPHANRDHRETHPDYGFDQLEVSDEPGVYEDAYRAWVRRLAPENLPHLSAGLPPATDVWYRTMGLRDTVPHPFAGGRYDFDGPHPSRGDERFTHTAFVAERTIDFLHAQSPHAPFLCIAGFYSPHSPWMTPQRFLDLYDPAALTLPTFPPEVQGRRGEEFGDAHLRLARQGYYGQISEVDHHVGRVLAALDDLGLADDTLVLFTSDHGEWLGEHLKWGKGYPGDDPVSRVPLLARWPAGLGRQPRRVEALVEHVDVVPTILDAAGMQLPPQLSGTSLLPLATGKAASVKDAALMEHAGWKTLRTTTHRYLLHEDGHEALFDLAAPWGEYRDVAAQQADIVADCRHRLLQRLLTMERPRTRTWAY